MKKTKKLVLAAIFSAIGVIVLALGALLEVLDISVAVFASLIVLFFVAEIGRGYAAAVYLTISALAALLIPLRSSVLLFILLFGYLPITKYLFERLGKWLGWVPKLLLYNGFLLVMWLAFREVTGITLENGLGIPREAMAAAYLLFSNLLMIVLDFLYDRLLRLYFLRIRPRIERYLK